MKLDMKKVLLLSAFLLVGCDDELDKAMEMAPAPALFDMAQKAYGLQDYASALRMLDYFCGHYPDDPKIADAYYRRAMVIYMQKEWKDARDHFANFLLLYPTHPNKDLALQFMDLCNRRDAEEAAVTARKAATATNIIGTVGALALGAALVAR